MTKFINRVTGLDNGPSLAAFAQATERISRALADRFSVSRSLGGSHSIELYLARDNSRGEEVVIKALRESAARDYRRREFFYLESYAASLLSHVNIVATSKAEEVNGIHFFIV